jgi:hypothetical protein
MAQLSIVTTPQNSGDGTPLATAFNYCNSNFSELYSRVQTDPPVSLTGTVGDTAGMYAYDSNFFYYCFADYDGINPIWGEISQAGNISVTSIARGTSNVSISDLNANVTMGVGGLGNIVVVATTGQYVTGVVSASGNVTGAYILGNGSQLTGLPATYTNSNVSTFMSSFGSNIISTSGNITAGNIAGGNLSTQGTVSATGNIVTEGFFIGNFSGNIVANITNLPGPAGAVVFNDGVGNAAATAGLVFDNSGPNVLTVLGAVSAQGNVQAGNLRTTGLVFTSGNVVGANINSNGILFASGNVVGSNVNTSGRVNATGNVSGGNILTGGVVSATGNIGTLGYLSVTQDLNVGGDITATDYTGTSLSLTGNVTSGNLTTAGRVSATGNLVTGSSISAAGNITGNFFLGNGSQLTGLLTNTIQSGNSNVLIGTSAGNVSINVNGVSPIALFTPVGATVVGNLSVSGNVVSTTMGVGTLTGSSVSISGNITGGNLNSSGLVTAGNLTTAGSFTATGNVSAGNLITAGSITAASLSVGSGNVTLGNIINSNGNSIGNIGSSTKYFNTVFARATSAQYADLAEIYVPDQPYDTGVVVIFGGSAEITICTEFADPRVAGVISGEPAHLMNACSPGIAVALRGRVPVNVVGPVTKGDSLVTDSLAGHARSIQLDRSYGQAVFAKSLETNLDPGPKVIQAVIL